MCPTVLDSLRTQRQRASSSFLWVFGPNPIFLGSDRDMELDHALKNQFVVAMQQKLDISQIHAEINLSTAKHLGKNWITARPDPQWVANIMVLTREREISRKHYYRSGTLI